MNTAAPPSQYAAFFNKFLFANWGHYTKRQKTYAERRGLSAAKIRRKRL
jgi:hypothetical protein